MIKLEINYTCGCGFKAKHEADAVRHCIDKQHSMAISGLIKKEDKPKVQYPED